MSALGIRTIRGRLTIGILAATVIGVLALGGAWTRLERLRSERTSASRELLEVSYRARALHAATIAVMTNGLASRSDDNAA